MAGSVGRNKIPKLTGQVLGVRRNPSQKQYQNKIRHSKRAQNKTTEHNSTFP